MAKKRFKLNTAIIAADETEAALKGYYNHWRSNNTVTKASFAAVFKAFKEMHLKDLEAGPLQLYLYFAFAADNDEGHSWHSISTIAEFFGKRTRTIDNWIKVLVDKDLIYRAQKGQKSHTTYLIPYDHTLIPHRSVKKRNKSDQINLNNLINKLQSLQFLYGEIFKVFHFFQWSRNKKGRPDSSDSTQAVFIITKRKNGVLIGHLYRLREFEHLSVDNLYIREPSVFVSPLEFNNTNIVGLALEHGIPIAHDVKDSLDALIILLIDLAGMEDWQLEEHPKIQYGEKDKFFPINDETDEEEIEEQSKQNTE